MPLLFILHVCSSSLRATSSVAEVNFPVMDRLIILRSPFSSRFKLGAFTDHNLSATADALGQILKNILVIRHKNLNLKDEPANYIVIINYFRPHRRFTSHDQFFLFVCARKIGRIGYIKRQPVSAC